MSEDVTFAEGFLFKEKPSSAPMYIIGKLSIKIDEAIPFLKQYQKNGWVNLEIKIARSGKPYIVLDVRKEETGRPNRNDRELPPESADPDLTPSPEPNDGGDDLPF